jgi:hypothetical protein
MSEKKRCCCCTFRPYSPGDKCCGHPGDTICCMVWCTIMFLIIAIPCLSVSLYSINDNYLHNEEIDLNYKMTQIIQQNNITNITQLSVDPVCVDTNMTMSDDISCDYVLQNNIYTSNTCLLQGQCTNNVCKYCSYVCFTKDCWIKTQQLKCIKSMSKNNCIVSYIDKSTYLCTKDPINSTAICQENCPDFSCQAYDLSCNCVCTNYDVKECIVIKSYSISSVSKIFYTVNNNEYLDINTYYNKTTNNMIYYNIKNPKKYGLSLIDLYENNSQQTSNLVIVGSLFMSIAAAILILGSIYLCLTFEIKCCYEIDLLDNPDDIAVQMISVVDKFNELICTICDTELKNPELMDEALLCAHVFHTKCIAEWKIKNMSCPVCRSIIPKSDVS